MLFRIKRSMTRTWHTEASIKMKLLAYMKHVTHIYSSEKKTVITSRKKIKKHCAENDPTMTDRVIETMEKEGIASIFSDGRNPTYEIDLIKLRNYLAGVSKDKE